MSEGASGRISKLEVTTDTLTSRGGLTFFVKYVEAVGILGLLLTKFEGIKKFALAKSLVEMKPASGQLIKLDACRKFNSGTLTQTPVGGSCSGLYHQRFPKRMMALDEKFVSPIESFEKPQSGHTVGFAADTTIAVLACEHQVPHIVDNHSDSNRLEDMREEMVNIGQRQHSQKDFREAVEAFALLVAVQRGPGACDGLPTPDVVGGNKRSGFAIEVDGHQAPRHLQFPCCFDQPPSGFRLAGKIRRLCALQKPG